MAPRMTLDKKKMGDKHEAWAAWTFNGRQSAGSGNQWKDPLDGRRSRYQEEFAWAWDCKSTRAKSFTVTRAMLEKLEEQAGSERPMLPIRFYDDDRLMVYEDWVLVKVDDFVELDDKVRKQEP